MRIKVADTVFEINNKDSYWEKFVSAYLTEEEPHHYIELSEEFLQEAFNASQSFSVGYTEYLETYREICNYMIQRDALLMHGAVIEYEGMAYMFTAPSGTGKTTHIRQWRKAFGKAVRVINGDKPIIRYKDGEFIAYGTPWCGKEHYNTNTSAPLKGIVLVSRGEENSIEEIPSDKFNLFLVKQLYLPKDPSLRMKVLELGDKLFTTVKLYHLKCNISTDAAILARDKIHK